MMIKLFTTGQLERLHVRLVVVWKMTWTGPLTGLGACQQYTYILQRIFIRQHELNQVSKDVTAC